MRKPIILLVMILASAFAIAQVAPDGEFYGSLGDFLLRNGQNAAALSAYEEGLKAEPENIHILNNLGYFHKDSDPKLAEEYFLMALQIDPNYEKARSNLALLYNKNENYDNAVEQLEKLTEEFPENVNYNYDLAINYANRFYYKTRNLADLDSGIKYFKITYDLDEDFMFSLKNIEVLEEIKRGY